jgi:outer membrane biosynthesis protein TonB
VSGKVVVHVEVDEDGRVSKAKATSGFGMLPEAAEKDALETRFPPARLSGQPVRVAGIIMYDYVLD